MKRKPRIKADILLNMNAKRHDINAQFVEYSEGIAALLLTFLILLVLA